MSWVAVCEYDELPIERGVAAMVGGEQLAIVRLPDGSVHAVSHFDPFSNANVMARGLVGSLVSEAGEIATLHSPMYKQAFDVRTGKCLSDSSASIGSWQVRINQGVVEVGDVVNLPCKPRQEVS